MTTQHHAENQEPTITHILEIVGVKPKRLASALNEFIDMCKSVNELQRSATTYWERALALSKLEELTLAIECDVAPQISAKDLVILIGLLQECNEMYNENGISKLTGILQSQTILQWEL